MSQQTVSTDVEIGEDHRVTIQLPKEVPTGKHRLTIVIESATDSPEAEEGKPWKFPILEGATWPEGMTFNRADLYDD